MNTRGFTLLETVITIALTVTVLVALTNLYVRFNTLYEYQRTFNAAAYEAGRAMNALGAAILPANQVVASYTFSGTLRSSDATSVVLKVPTVNAAGDMVSAASDYIAFYRSGTDLYRVTDANAASIRTSGSKKIATLVDSLTFTYDNADITKSTSVLADIVTRTTSQQGLVETRLHEQFYLRNI